MHFYGSSLVLFLNKTNKHSLKLIWLPIYTSILPRNHMQHFTCDTFPCNITQDCHMFQYFSPFPSPPLPFHLVSHSSLFVHNHWFVCESSESMQTLYNVNCKFCVDLIIGSIRSIISHRVILFTASTVEKLQLKTNAISPYFGYMPPSYVVQFLLVSTCEVNILRQVVRRIARLAPTQHQAERRCTAWNKIKVAEMYLVPLDRPHALYIQYDTVRNANCYVSNCAGALHQNNEIL